MNPLDHQALVEASPAPKYTRVETLVVEMRENMLKVGFGFASCQDRFPVFYLVITNQFGAVQMTATVQTRLHL